jgi:hypothetical protein
VDEFRSQLFLVSNVYNRTNQAETLELSNIVSMGYDADAPLAAVSWGCLLALDELC